MNKETQEAVTQFAGVLRAMGAPHGVLDGFMNDCEIAFGLPGQEPDPKESAAKVASIRASLRATAQNPQLMAALPPQLRDLIKKFSPDQAAGPAITDAIGMGSQEDAEKLAELMKKTLPNAEVRVVSVEVLLLAGVVHDLKQLNIPEVNALRSFRAAEELVAKKLPNIDIALEDKPEPQLSAEHQALIDALTKAGAPETMINELRAQFLGGSAPGH